jgi:hypothetical protein
METKNKRGGLKTYQAFTPPSPYEMERRKAEQQRRYAELLQEQAMAEDEPYTYQGIRAMPSPAAALGKLLKAYGAKKASEKAEEAEARKAGMEQQASQQIMGRLFGGAPMSQADTTPDESGLAEVAVQSQYRQDPTDAMRFASTPQGAAAVKGNPMLAAMLQRQMEAPASEEYYAPTETADGKLVQFGRGGGKRETGYVAPSKPVAGSSLSKLIAERDALPPNSPLLKTYNDAIAKETTASAPVRIDLGDKGSAIGQEIFLKDIGEMRPRAYAATNIIRAVNNLDRLTQKGTYTGSLAPNAVGAGQFLNSIGIKIDPKTLQNTEAFSAQVSDLVMSAQAALGGARGFTKEETAILMQMFPQIINSPEARVTIGNIIRNKQLEVIDEYDSLINDYKETYKDSRIPYKPIDDEEVRYQRWKRSQGGR